MISISEIREFVSRFHFGLWNATFLVKDESSELGGLQIELKIEVVDHRTGAMIPVWFMQRLGEINLTDWREIVADVVGGLVKKAVEHEMYEHWQFDDQLIRDPHRSSLGEPCPECRHGAIMSVHRRAGTFVCSNGRVHAISTVNPAALMTQHPIGAGNGSS